MQVKRVGTDEGRLQSRQSLGSWSLGLEQCRQSLGSWSLGLELNSDRPLTSDWFNNLALSTFSRASVFSI